MVPDVNAYAPHVQAVFGLLEPADPRYIPYTLADQGQRHHDPLLGALEKILALPQSRLAVSDLLDLLEVPALRARFGIAEDQLPLLHRWVRQGQHPLGPARRAAGAASTCRRPPAQNSWDVRPAAHAAGLCGGGRATPGQGVEPLDEIGGLDAALLGPLVRSCWRGWSQALAHAGPAGHAARVGRAAARSCSRPTFSWPTKAATASRCCGSKAGLQDWLDACAGGRAGRGAAAVGGARALAGAARPVQR